MKIFVATLTVWLAWWTPAALHAGNALAGHPSPYLAMHGEDPVSWQTWQRTALEQARRQQRLIYVSVGYFSCHWCHVMHRESYQDVSIAGILNERFVPVKVDRELEPSLDSHLMEFVVATRGHGGWPLNVFLTPDGHPLIGFTYLPPVQFRSVLERLGERWDQDRESLSRAALEAARLIQRQRVPSDHDRLSPSMAQSYQIAFLRQAAQIADLEAGGFGDGMKFPVTPQLGRLLAIVRDHPDPALERFLRLTLRQMADGGIRDQLGGGFFRYSTDRNWRVPHFEKMLYDNALMAELYLNASQALHEPSYRLIANDTLDFMLRELWQDGALIASLSAVDDAQVEGGYYLWTETTLTGLLSADELAVARLAWGLEGEPPLEHGYVPRRERDDQAIAGSLGKTPGQVASLRDSALKKLLAERGTRRLPRDVKRLAGWNGLALAALSKAAVVTDTDRGYATASKQLRDYVSRILWNGNELMRAIGPRGPLGTASLQDYAFVARGMLAYSRLSEDADDLALARDLIDAAWARFRTPEGWRQSEDPLIPYGPAEAIVADGALPSPSAILLDTTLEVAALQGDEELRGRALKVLWVENANVAESPYAYATHIGLLSEYPPRAPAAP